MRAIPVPRLLQLAAAQAASTLSCAGSEDGDHRFEFLRLEDRARLAKEYGSRVKRHYKNSPPDPNEIIAVVERAQSEGVLPAELSRPGGGWNATRPSAGSRKPSASNLPQIAAMGKTWESQRLVPDVY